MQRTAILLFLLLVACGSSPQAGIVGTWQITQLGEEAVAADEAGSYVFSQDGSFILTNADQSEVKGTYELREGGELVLTSDGKEFLSGDAKVNGSQLTLDTDGSGSLPPITLQRVE